MSMKLMLSAAALVALSATSAMAAPVFVASPYCDQAVSRQACGDHMNYVQSLRSRAVRRDTSLSYMKNLDPRENPALRDAGGGGGGVVVVVAVAADNQYRSRTARWRISKNVRRGTCS